MLNTPHWTEQPLTISFPSYYCFGASVFKILSETSYIKICYSPEYECSISTNVNGIKTIVQFGEEVDKEIFEMELKNFNNEINRIH